jgi:hypothetical protein
MAQLTLTKTPEGDTAVRAAWGLSAFTWATLTDAERVNYRDRVAYAPNLGGVL